MVIKNNADHPFTIPFIKGPYLNGALSKNRSVTNPAPKTTETGATVHAKGAAPAFVGMASPNWIATSPGVTSTSADRRAAMRRPHHGSGRSPATLTPVATVAL